MLVVFVLAAVPGSAPNRTVVRAAQVAVAQDDARLAKLPDALRERGRLILTEAGDEKRADLAEALAEADAIGALDFLLALLDTDPSADVREETVDAPVHRARDGTFITTSCRPAISRKSFAFAVSNRKSL